MFTCQLFLNKVGKRISWPWKPHKALRIRLCRDVRAFTLAQETGRMGSVVCVASKRCFYLADNHKISICLSSLRIQQGYQVEVCAS